MLGNSHPLALRHSIRMSETPDWKQFEDAVADTYVLLGFQVETDTLLSGQQCDVVAEKSERGGVFSKLLIEVKSGESRLSNADVQEFHNTYMALRSRHGFNQAVMVTRVDPSRFARQAAADCGVRILTFDELRHELLDFRPYLNSFLAEYELDPVKPCYVPLHFGHTSEWKSTDDEQAHDLHDHVREWLDDDTILLMIFGDYGSGKTTYLRHLMYCLSKHYLHSGLQSRIPLLITLRNYSKDFSLHTCLQSHLESRCGIQEPYSTVETFLKRGRFVLLLDGFDELATKSAASVRKLHFDEITRMFYPANKILLTCRPGYFLTGTELHEIVGSLGPIMDPYVDQKSPSRTKALNERSKLIDDLAPRIDVVENGLPSIQNLEQCLSDLCYLKPFSDEQIAGFLKNHEEKIRSAGLTSWGEVSRRIHSTYNLADLARRPILLKIIVDTVPYWPEDKPINSSVLYEVYTGFWIDRDHRKGRHLINKERKRTFMTHLAVQMLREDTLLIPYTRLSEEIKESFSISDSSELEYFVTDIATCSFLNRDAQGNYAYIHKSFMEFFSATYCLDAMMKGDVGELKRRYVPTEVLRFLSEFLRGHAREANLLREKINSLRNKRLSNRESMLLSNCLTVFGMLSEGIEAKRFVAFQAKHMQLRGIAIRQFEVQEGNLWRCEFSGDTWDSVKFRKTECEDCDFEKCEVSVIESIDTLWRNCRLRESAFDGVGWSNGSFFGCEFEEVTFRNLVVVGTEFNRCEFANVRFENCKFIFCSFVGCHGNAVFETIRTWMCRVQNCDECVPKGERENRESQQRRIEKSVARLLDRMSAVDRAISKERERSREQLRKAKHELEQTTQKLTSTIAELKSLSKEVERLTQRKAQVSQAKEDLEERASPIRKQLESMKEEMNRLEQRKSPGNQLSSDDRWAIQNSCEQIKKDREAASNKLKPLTDKIKTANTELKSIRKRIKEDERKKEAAASNQANYERREKDKSLECDQMKTALEVPLDGARRSAFDKEVEGKRELKDDLIVGVALMAGNDLRHVSELVGTDGLTQNGSVYFTEKWDDIKRAGRTLSLRNSE